MEHNYWILQKKQNISSASLFNINEQLNNFKVNKRQIIKIIYFETNFNCQKI